MSPNPQETADLITFTEEILNGKLHSFCAVFFNVCLTNLRHAFRVRKHQIIYFDFMINFDFMVKYHA